MYSILILWCSLQYWIANMYREIETWRIADHKKKNPAYYHKIRVIEIFALLILESVCMFQRHGWWSIGIVICMNIIGIILYEFIWCYKIYGDWKYHKAWGWEVQLFNKVWKIEYPKWQQWTIIGIIAIISFFIMIRIKVKGKK